MTHDGIQHAAHCSKPKPLLRLSWRGTPETWCAACGRYAPADDTRPTLPNPEETPR